MSINDHNNNTSFSYMTYKYLIVNKRCERHEASISSLKIKI